MYIIYDSNFDNELFLLWLNHYATAKLPYKIFIEENNIDVYESFCKEYPSLIGYVTHDIFGENFQLTIDDFLFTYDKDDNDNMMLTYNFKPHHECTYK